MTGKDERDAESRRIIKRVGEETEASMAGRAARRARDHLAGKDADQEDWAELWGTRIGRVLSIALLIAALGWLLSVIMRMEG